MQRMKFACYALMASAIVLATLLLALVSGGWAQRAEAGQVLATPGGSTLMTIRANSDNEVLLLLDDAAERLLILQTNVETSRLEVTQTVALGALFTRR